MKTDLVIPPARVASAPAGAIQPQKSAVRGRERVRRGPMAQLAPHVEVLIMTVAWRGEVMGRAHFSLGEVFATGRALDLLERNQVPPEVLLARHAAGDCEARGDGETYRLAAVKDGTRVLSSYTLPDERQVFLMTEADRSATLIYLFGE